MTDTKSFDALKSRTEAYAWADANGFTYTRSRIGFGLYRNANVLLEIGELFCSRYRPGTESKASRRTARRYYSEACQ